MCPQRNVCTSFCIFRWSTWEVYLCHTGSKHLPLPRPQHPPPPHHCGLQSDAAAMGLISFFQSDSVRFKATKPQGSRAAAACSAQQQLQIWWNWTSQTRGCNSCGIKREGLTFKVSSVAAQKWCLKLRFEDIFLFFSFFYRMALIFTFNTWL